MRLARPKVIFACENIRLDMTECWSYMSIFDMHHNDYIYSGIFKEQQGKRQIFLNRLFDQGLNFAFTGKCIRGTVCACTLCSHYIPHLESHLPTHPCTLLATETINQYNVIFEHIASVFISV